jgi:hypothetical protein
MNINAADMSNGGSPLNAPELLRPYWLIRAAENLAAAMTLLPASPGVSDRDHEHVGVFATCCRLE